MLYLLYFHHYSGPKFLTKFIFNFKPSDLKYFHSFIQIATIEVGPGFGVVFCGLLGFWFSYAHQASHFPSRSSLSATTPSRRPIFDPDLVSLQLRLPGVLFSIQISFLFNYAFHTSYFPSRPSFSAITLPGLLFSIQIYFPCNYGY